MLGTASPERHQRTGAVVQRRARRRPAESGAPVLLWQLESKKKKTSVRTYMTTNLRGQVSSRPLSGHMLVQRVPNGPRRDRLVPVFDYRSGMGPNGPCPYTSVRIAYLERTLLAA